MRPSVWFDGSDMIVQVDALRSSTMAAGAYLNGSGGVTAAIWSALTTGNAANLQKQGTLVYVSGSNGRYQLVVQTTDHGMARGALGMAVVKVAHGGLNREWRPTFRVDTGRY